jgi:hypothetical protein
VNYHPFAISDELVPRYAHELKRCICGMLKDVMLRFICRDALQHQFCLPCSFLTNYSLLQQRGGGEQELMLLRLYIVWSVDLEH